MNVLYSILIFFVSTVFKCIFMNKTLNYDSLLEEYTKWRSETTLKTTLIKN